MYIKNNACVRTGKKIVLLHKFSPEFMVRNKKLSPKPQKAAEKLKEMVEGPNSIVKYNDVSMRQDYDNGTVTLNLLSQCYIIEAGGRWAKGTDQGRHIVCSTVLPATAAVKRYTKALKEMVENKAKEKNHTPIINEKPKKKWYQFWK